MIKTTVEAPKGYTPAEYLHRLTIPQLGWVVKYLTLDGLLDTEYGHAVITEVNKKGGF